MFEKWLKNWWNWQKGLVFEKAEWPTLPSASEQPKKKAEMSDKLVKQRRDLNVEEDLMDEDGAQTVEKREAQNAVDRIEGARKEVDKKRDAYFEVVRKMYYDGVKVKAGDVRMAEYSEKVALAYQDLVGSYQEIIAIQEQAKDPEFVRKLAGDLLKIEVPLIQTKKIEETRPAKIDLMDLTNPLDPKAMKRVANKTEVYKTSYKTEVVKQTFEIPRNSQEYMILQNGAMMAVTSARANLFLLTGDKKHEGDYKQDIAQRNINFATNGMTAIERAEKADAKGLSGVSELMRTQDNGEKYQQVEEYIGIVVGKQLEIEKLRISDPLRAFALANQLYAELDNLRKDMSGSLVEKKVAGLPTDLHISMTADGHFRTQMDAKFFQELKKSSPKVFQRFSQLVDISHNKAARLAREIIGKDPEILQFQRDLSGFVKSGEGLFKTFDNLMKDMQRGATPSKPYMAKIHEDLDRYINSPYFKNIKKNWPRQKYLSYLNQDLSAVPGAKKMIEGWEKGYNALDEYKTKIMQVAEELKDIGGDNVGVIGLLKDIGKYAVIIGACVATNGALALNGVIGSGVAGGVGMFTTISTISAVSTLTGAGLDYLDGNGKAFDPLALLQSYVQGMIISGATGVLAKPVGILWGNAAKRFNDVLAKSRFSWLRTFAEKGYLNEAFEKKGKETALRKFLEEVSEETFEEGLEAVGRAIAPHDAWVGFMLSLLGTSARTAKNVFNKGKFQIRNSLRGEVTDTGVKLEYVNIEEATKFLRGRGLDAESIAKLEKDGSLVVEKDGMRLEVVKEVAKKMSEIPNLDEETIDRLDALTFGQKGLVKSKLELLDFEAEGVIDAARVQLQNCLGLKIPSVNDLARVKIGQIITYLSGLETKGKVVDDDHVVFTGDMAYSVNDLIVRAKQLTLQQISLQKFGHAMDNLGWADSVGTKISPSRVLQRMREIKNDGGNFDNLTGNDLLLAEHFRRVLNADVRHPIIVANIDEEEVVLDGMHRLVRMFFLGSKTIPVQRFAELPIDLGLKQADWVY